MRLTAGLYYSGEPRTGLFSFECDTKIARAADVRTNAMCRYNEKQGTDLHFWKFWKLFLGMLTHHTLRCDLLWLNRHASFFFAAPWFRFCDNGLRQRKCPFCPDCPSHKAKPDQLNYHIICLVHSGKDKKTCIIKMKTLCRRSQEKETAEKCQSAKSWQ